MFKNIGKKLKSLASVIFYMGLLISIGFALNAFVPIVLYNNAICLGDGLISAFETAAIGIAISFFLSYITYAEGQKIDDNRRILKELSSLNEFMFSKSNSEK